jgi:hypothetical protein
MNPVVLALGINISVNDIVKRKSLYVLELWLKTLLLKYAVV